MKPVRLVMQAFGPYAATTELDFQKLHGKPLVLLHGPTGGGKTAILDAMCFGLFGKSSGDERQAGDLRSDLAADEDLTRITFDFLHGERLLRVVREPTQQKKKSRGSGTIEHKSRAWLWDRSAVAHDPTNEGILLAEKPKGVDVEVRRLLGFSEDQFRQIVVLPQGRFRDFLSAPAKDKEKILKSLFGTAIYETITEELQKETAALKERFADNETRRKSILERVGDADVEALAARIHSMETALAPLKVEVKDCESLAAAATAAWQQGEANNKRHDEKAAAMQRLDALGKQAPTVKEQEIRLQRISNVKPLLPLAEALADAERTCERARTASRLAGEELNGAEAHYAQMHAILSHEQGDERKIERESAERRVIELEGLRDEVNSYQEVVAKTDAAGAGLELSLEAERKAETELESLRAKVAELQQSAETLAALELENARAERQETEYDKLKALFVEAMQLQMSTDELDAAIEKLHVEELASSLALDVAENERTQVYLRWHQGQAARLAAQLQVGEPCPVCGGTEHPAPHANSNQDLPNESQLKAADETLAGQQKAVEKIRLDLGTRQTRRADLVEQAAAKRALLGEMASLTLADWQAKGDELAARKKQRDAKMKEAREANLQLANVKLQIPTLEAACQDAVTKRTDAALHAQEMKTKLASYEARLPEALREARAFESALVAAQETRNACRHRLESAQQNDNLAAQARLIALEKAQNATRRTAETELEMRDAQQRLLQKRAEGALLDDALFQSTLADSANETTLLEDVRRYQRALDEARGGLEQAVQAVGDTAYADLDTLRQKRDGAIAEAQSKTKRLHETESNLRFLQEEKSRYDALVEQSGKEEERYRTVAALSDAASGKNPRRLSLQRYVLASLLDDVLAHASERLRNMSTGRYRVLRDDSVRDARLAGGLELLVEDQYTGERRPISTLSGGESFQAALALSLGLADVIQALAGGIRVDALFIDEGFGTLDGEALERAIEELLKLRDGGRLVGIISHVAELRHRISARIEVSKSDRGSRIAVHAGD